MGAFFYACRTATVRFSAGSARLSASATGSRLVGWRERILLVTLIDVLAGLENLSNLRGFIAPVPCRMRSRAESNDRYDAPGIRGETVKITKVG